MKFTIYSISLIANETKGTMYVVEFDSDEYIFKVAK